MRIVRDAAEVQAGALAEGEPLPDIDLLIALSAKADSEVLTFDRDQLKMKGRLASEGVTVSSP